MNGQFRKLDCVVLILCIVVVMFIAGAVGKRGQELNKRMICTSNVRQLTAGFINVANDNGGIFPTSGGFWPWDFSSTNINKVLGGIGEQITNPLPPQDVFYCPTNSSQQLMKEMYWNWSSYRIIGYVFLCPSSWNSNGSLPALGTGNKKWASSIYIDNPAETELIVDATLSQKFQYDIAIYPNGNFGKITVGGTSSDMSNHIKTMAEPYGGNIGFVDGHVEWRPFEKMQLRHITSGNNINGDPRWWW